MNLNSLVSKVKKRVANGENIDAILEELSKKGVSEKDLKVIVDYFISTESQKIFKKKKDLSKIIFNKYSIYIYIFIIIVLCGFAYKTFVNPYFLEDGLLYLTYTPVAFNESMIMDPIQTPTNKEPFSVEQNGQEWTISPVATYNVSILVAGKKEYNDEQKLAPIDLIFVWGKIATNGYEDYIHFSQGFRRYFYRYDSNSPVSYDYIVTHTANTHIIPANDNILAGLKTIKRNENAIMHGYLVNVYSNSGREWKTSKIRGDTFDGSCEIFYVESLKIGNIEYK